MIRSAILGLALAFAISSMCHVADAQSRLPTLLIPMPAVVVLIVCKTEQTGETELDLYNSKWTGHEGRDWATEGAMMVCRRQEVEMYDRAVDGGADPQSFNMERCMRSAMMMGPMWDVQHKSSKYRFWRVGCPVPIVRQNPDGTEDIIACKLPDCGHRETVICEVDTAI